MVYWIARSMIIQPEVCIQNEFYYYNYNFLSRLHIVPFSTGPMDIPLKVHAVLIIGIPHKLYRYDHDATMDNVNMRRFKPPSNHLFSCNENSSPSPRRWKYDIMAKLCIAPIIRCAQQFQAQMTIHSLIKNTFENP